MSILPTISREIGGSARWRGLETVSWLAARADDPDLTETETREALARLDPLWDELFPAEQARIVRLLVERVEVGPAGADIRLRMEGLAGLIRDLTTIAPEALRAAA